MYTLFRFDQLLTEKSHCHRLVSENQDRLSVQLSNFFCCNSSSDANQNFFSKHHKNLVSKKHCVAKKLPGNVNGDQIVQMFSLSQFLSTNLDISNVVFACWQTWIALVTFQAACHSVILSPPPSPPSPCGSPPWNIKQRHTGIRIGVYSATYIYNVRTHTVPKIIWFSA